MHMAFLSREFKNLQWYGMTYRADVTDFSYIRIYFYLKVLTRVLFVSIL